MKDVMIKVLGIQSQPDGTDEDRIELVTEGKYDYANDKITITYDESELTGFIGCVTTFTVYPDYIILNRQGELNTDMIFDNSRRHVCHYDTPVGNMCLGIVTLDSKCTLNENGGHMEVHYLLDVDNIAFSRNSFIIDVE